eukprot:Em0014g862a
MANKPFLLPETFSGESGTKWDEWINHFESCADVNNWTKDEDRLKWVRVRLVGKAQTAFRRLGEDERTDYTGCRFWLGMAFSSEAEKDAFKLRVDSARRILFPYESTSQRPDNAALLNAMLDMHCAFDPIDDPLHHPVHSFFLGHSRHIYTGDEGKDDQRLCVVEHKAIRCLCQGLVQQHCCRPRPTWQLESFMKKGGIVRIRFVCPHCKVARTWASSRVLAGHYLASQKQVAMHSAEESMNAAVQRVKANAEYVTSGEWVIIDARQDSSANAYHSTVPCMAGRVTTLIAI